MDEAPRYNYTRDPYFTDGLRVVLFLDEQYVSSDRLEMLDWESPVETVRDDPGRLSSEDADGSL